MSVKLQPVKKTDIKFLYDLLNERDPIFNISHKKMPTYDEHLKFVLSKPYSKWYVVYANGIKVGSAYLSKQNEIGIHIKKEFSTEKIRQAVLDILIEKNPKKRYLANINPHNKKTIRFFKKNGFRLIQYTFELLK
ncbi:MAG: GNAT family protein [Candidatus Nitrosotenuis sp.]